jgi:hypothetical protein
MKARLEVIRNILLFCIVLFQSGGNLYALAQQNDKYVVGWIEYVALFPKNLKIKAKLDTGARHSSLNAVNIAEFKRGENTFVRFEVTNWKGRTEKIEAPVIRMAKIKQHNSEPERRPVIRIGICLGQIYREAEVNLVNRSNFNYQLLIGRSFLRGKFVVDPSKTFTIKTDCQKVLQDE